MKNLLSSLLAGLLCSVSCIAQAAWPDKPISLVVPFPPGGATDFVGRLIGKELSERLKVSVVVENRSGAAGNVGSRYVARSKADGYTLLIGTTAQTIGAALYKDVGYDIVNDFEAISTINEGPLILISRPGLEVSSVEELVRVAKSRPQELTYGSPGNGTSSHMAMEVFSLATGLKMVHVPFQGAGPAMNALIGEQVDIAFDEMSSGRQHVDAKRVQGIGIATRERSPLAPEWVTLAEQSPQMLSGFHEAAWTVLLAPKGTPRAIIDTLNAEMKAILESEPIRARFAGLGNLTIWQSAEDTQAFIARDVEKWKRVVQDADIEQL
ncbi:hypothetical protein CAL18_01570 [Bordetella genomosp. 7]|uniref:tripartite tricarboxylate transporter substrate binding protein n=1 Tax=Bordetella genomosp. 7 TaxID=1416805 RepID=UPI000B9DF214|nr:tripartite tricarboxylate transporter substrate binding protein [Bordetella genomosp. 7]OZI29621.1 hypothetical protein CAL18_01570 [Bordetella genomosp. 7]